MRPLASSADDRLREPARGRRPARARRPAAAQAGAAQPPLERDQVQPAGRSGAVDVRAGDGRWTDRAWRTSGRGIPPTASGRLFTPFERLGAEQTDGSRGRASGSRSRGPSPRRWAARSTFERTDRRGERRSGSSCRRGRRSAAGAETPGVHAPITRAARTAHAALRRGQPREPELVDTILLSRPGWRPILRRCRGSSASSSRASTCRTSSCSTCTSPTSPARRCCAACAPTRARRGSRSSSSAPTRPRRRSSACARSAPTRTSRSRNNG